MREPNAYIFLHSSDESHHRIKCICIESLHLLCDNQTGGRERAFLSSDDGKDQSSWGARMEGAGPIPMFSCLLEHESVVERDTEGAACLSLSLWHRSKLRSSFSAISCQQLFPRTQSCSERERFKYQNESSFFMSPVTCCNQLCRYPDAHSPYPLNLNTQGIAATLAMSF